MNMQILYDFLSDCKARRRSTRTLETYKSNISEFLKHFPEPETVDKRDLRYYLEYLQDRGLKDSTLKGYFSALSTFYNFLIYEEIAFVNPILPFRERFLDRPTKHDRRQLLTLPEMREYVGSIDSIMSLTMVVTLAKHGARREEFRQLNRENIDMDRKRIIYPQRAKRNNRVLPIDDELYRLFEEYLPERDKRAKSNALWISSRGGRIHKDDSNKIIAGYAVPLGFHNPDGPLDQKLTTHCFRKFMTHHLYANGARDATIKIVRGDSLQKQAWTSNYLEPDELTEEVTEEFLRCSPPLL
jgi:integrase/recombinase XerD